MTMPIKGLVSLQAVKKDNQFRLTSNIWIAESILHYERFLQIKFRVVNKLLGRTSAVNGQQGIFLWVIVNFTHLYKFFCISLCFCMLSILWKLISIYSMSSLLLFF